MEENDFNDKVNRILKEAENSHLTDNTAMKANAFASQNVALSVQQLKSVIADSVNELIKSNTQLSISNYKRSRAMNWLTFGLVFVGILQLIWSIISFFISN
ncbi:MAG: hypothetical protein NTW62_03225 [Candidatus Nomurabacteria bacterium]|nr:hypothetical protein [Candidatus Nomurabacteria bacterium]